MIGDITSRTINKFTRLISSLSAGGEFCQSWGGRLAEASGGSSLCRPSEWGLRTASELASVCSLWRPESAGRADAFGVGVGAASGSGVASADAALAASAGIAPVCVRSPAKKWRQPLLIDIRVFLGNRNILDLTHIYDRLHICTVFLSSSMQWITSPYKTRFYKIS